ncbi:MAG: cysteine desulfurase family protein, partial [Patescibacteria group bacterium]
NCRPSEIIFCGTATEANNLAILGTARAFSLTIQAKSNTSQPTSQSSSQTDKIHVITSSIEHSAVRNPFEQLEKEGFSVTHVPSDKEGFINPQDIEKAITSQTTLVSIMYANNEIGTIEPIKEIGEICKKHNIPFHTDACQAAAIDPLNVNELNVSLLTLNGSKIYGPKGIGILYVKQGTKIEPIIHGGSHEKGLRAGTHNVPAIVGFATAFKILREEKEKGNAHLILLRNKLIEGILKTIPDTYLNGPSPSSNKRLPANASITFKGINGQELLLQMDESGIYVSSGAACSEGTEKPSTTLCTIGLPQNLLHGTIRFSFGKQNTENDVEYVLKTLPEIVRKLRQRT